MKHAPYILTIIAVLSSCNDRSSQIDNTEIVDNCSHIQNADNSKYHTQLDTILISTEIGDTLKYAKTDFNTIIDKHPEFFQEFPESPDNLYYRFVHDVDFGSEQGRDVYYILYAYFLKQRNGGEKYARQRKQLIAIYSNINSLFGHFQYGGTYFGHQRSRILGYAEYSIYLMPKNNDDISKTYDITKQRAFYTNSLRQLIEDESKIDFETLGRDKAERNNKLHKIVDELDRLITSNFYLRRAQEFHHEHYEYY